ncbi:uncharacterized protein LOC142605981 [Castanea sativa]|uniref:uncharacterized protein LOC142605981 n=1 Tax=Castanea sativa TaxID=21020 RepID=UPI003F6547C0
MGKGHLIMAWEMTLAQISKSPFVRRINKARLPYWFSQPTFSLYNGSTNPVEHVSHFSQKMAVHIGNEALMCEVFPSSLGLMAMRWFDALQEGSIWSFRELTRVFGARFVMCSRVPKPLGSLLSMVMRERETLNTYLDRYWEMYNEIDGDFEDVAVRIFKVWLLTEHELRKSLTMKPSHSMRQLMDRIDKYKRVEENQTQGKGNAKALLEKRDSRGGGYYNNQPRRDVPNQTSSAGAQVINSLFKEPIYQILEKIKK